MIIATEMLHQASNTTVSLWSFGRKRETVSSSLAQGIWRTTTPVLSENVFPRAKPKNVDWLELADAETGEVFSGARTFKTVEEGLRKQILPKMGYGRKHRRIIPAKSTEQSNRSRRSDFTNVYHWSSLQVFFSTNLFHQFLKFFEKTHLLTPTEETIDNSHYSKLVGQPLIV